MYPYGGFGYPGCAPVGYGCYGGFGGIWIVILIIFLVLIISGCWGWGRCGRY